QQLVGETERLEHLDGATGDAVGLSDLEWTIPTIDDSGPDVREVAQLRGQHQPRRTASDDQDIHIRGKAPRPLPDRRVRVGHERVTGPVTVEIELHRSRPPRGALKSTRQRWIYAGHPHHTSLVSRER